MVKRIVSSLGSILATASWAPKVRLRLQLLVYYVLSANVQEYMKAINAAAEADITGRYRPKGFTLTDALVGEKSLLGSAKCQQRLKKGDVIIYVDQKGLLLKVKIQIRTTAKVRRSMQKVSRKTFCCSSRTCATSKKGQNIHIVSQNCCDSDWLIRSFRVLESGRRRNEKESHRIATACGRLSCVQKCYPFKAWSK